MNSLFYLFFVFPIWYISPFKGPIWGKYNSCCFWPYQIQPYMLRKSSARNFILIHSRTLCCSKATAGILLKNAWVEVAVGFANRFSTKNHCGLGYYLKIALIWFLFQFRSTSNVVFGSFFFQVFSNESKKCWIYSCLLFWNRRLILKVSVHY